MADFCGQCSEKLFGKIDYKPQIKDDEVVSMLCEGCGKAVFIDNSGYKVGCQFCIYGDEGVCEFAGEIGDDFFCEKFKRKT
jgi:RNase P subunit RPR2